MTRPGAIADRKYAVGRAMSEYRTVQQSRHLVPVGDAWVPEAVAPQLEVRAQAAVRRIAAAPCKACLGLGLADCQKCSGTARVKCTNRGCVGGMVTVKAGDRLGHSLEHQERCKICGGVGVIACEKCRGSGAVLCKTCNGTGEREPCSRCSGEGISRCQRCGGRGESGGVACKSCGGKGEVLCTSCQGDGRK
jgi:hypothetical protein